MSVSVVAGGDIILYFGHSEFLVLKDCYYILNFIRNLISVECLKKQGYFIEWSCFISIYNKVVCSDWKLNNLYFVQPKPSHWMTLKGLMMKKLLRE